MLRRRPSPALVVAFLALVASLSGVAVAAIPARDGDVHLCYDRRTGQIEAVDTQSDRFRCDRNWAGLIIDTKPTSLVSPNGRFRVEVTNTGVLITGPDSRIRVGADDVSVTTGKGTSLRAGTNLDLRGGTGLSLLSAGNLGATAQTGLALAAGGDLRTQAGASTRLESGTTFNVAANGLTQLQTGGDLELLPQNNIRIRTRQVLLESFLDTLIRGRDIDILASGQLRLRGSQVSTNR